jgi:hypothetical protein
MDLATAALVEEVMAGGIVVARSVGEPGTRLMKTTFPGGRRASTTVERINLVIRHKQERPALMPNGPLPRQRTGQTQISIPNRQPAHRDTDYITLLLCPFYAVFLAGSRSSLGPQPGRFQGRNRLPPRRITEAATT